MKLKGLLYRLNRRDTRLFPRLKPLAKFILIFTLIIGSIFLTKKIFAQNYGWGNLEINIDKTAFIETYLDKQGAIESGSNLEAWVNESIISNTVSLNSALIGDIKKEDIASGNWVPGGLIGLTNNSTTALYQPPISGVQYIAHTIDNFLGKPTYAANGFGFDQLSRSNATNGIMSLWKTMRNTVYTLFSLFFIILGIMIMLRVKISPQATISIQAILPKIIISLVLVTFSYAIVGLLIDFSYVLQGLVLSLIDSSNGSNTINGVLTGYDVPKLMNLNFHGIRQITSNYFITPTSQTFVRGISVVIGAVIGIFTGGLNPGGLVLGILGGSLGFFIIDAFIWWQVVKLFFGLAKCYINILLKIIIAPLEIGLGVFPGSKVNFSSWIVQLIANLVVFPATIIFLVIIIIFIRAVGGNGSNLFWAPNTLANGEIVGFIIGLTGIILLSKIPQIVPEFLFNIKPSPMGKMIGDSYKGYANSGLVNRAKNTGKIIGVQGAGWALEKAGGKLHGDFGDRVALRGKLYQKIAKEAIGAEGNDETYIKTKVEKLLRSK